LIADNDVLIVDEAQFLSPRSVDQLKDISKRKIVLCFGLKNNFLFKLFEGSKRLLEVSDNLFNINSGDVCVKCDVNVAEVDFRDSNVDSEILIGNDEYIKLCWFCWKIETAGGL
jgi:thymidine kinase